MSNTQTKRWRRGDVGPDGRIFWKYQKSAKNGEYWVTKKSFEIKKATHRRQYIQYIRKNPDHEKRRRREYMARIVIERPDIARKWSRNHYRKKANQIAADQFFILTAASQEITKALTEYKTDDSNNKPKRTESKNRQVH